jgi:hypothetical protein
LASGAVIERGFAKSSSTQRSKISSGILTIAPTVERANTLGFPSKSTTWTEQDYQELFLYFLWRIQARSATMTNREKEAEDV